MTGLPELSTVEVSSVDDRTTDDFWLHINDFVTPPSLFLCNATQGAPELLKQSPAFFDASHSVVSQHEAVSKDGTRVPYFEVDPKVLALDSHMPTLLTGYGGFNLNQAPAFSPFAAAWMANGGVYAVANLRGGGEFGEAWHLAGNLTRKQNVFDDFYGCAQRLVKEGATTPDRLARVRVFRMLLTTPSRRLLMVASATGSKLAVVTTSG